MPALPISNPRQTFSTTEFNNELRDRHAEISARVKQNIWLQPPPKFEGAPPPKPFTQRRTPEVRVPDLKPAPAAALRPGSAFVPTSFANATRPFISKRVGPGGSGVPERPRLEPVPTRALARSAYEKLMANAAALRLNTAHKVSQLADAIAPRAPLPSVAPPFELKPIKPHEPIPGPRKPVTVNISLKPGPVTAELVEDAVMQALDSEAVRHLTTQELEAFGMAIAKDLWTKLSARLVGNTLESNFDFTDHYTVRDEAPAAAPVAPQRNDRRTRDLPQPRTSELPYPRLPADHRVDARLPGYYRNGITIIVPGGPFTRTDFDHEYVNEELRF